jgi:hypothetical protein
MGTSNAECSRWEQVAWVAIWLSVVVLISAVVFLVFGPLGADAPPVLRWLASDDMALLWVTVAGSTHLILVPATCVVIAFRDQRLLSQGRPIPPPRSVWVGHESVFGSRVE